MEITDKGYCFTKSLYFYGIKVQTLAFFIPKKMPFREKIVITSELENDLNVDSHN